MAWVIPRTWIPGELVTASMMNTHVRDNLNALRSEHFGVQQFRGLHLRTHPDADAETTKVMLVHADEIVMDDGTRVANWDTFTADISLSGAGGLDVGSEVAAEWYEIYAIRKSVDGTKNLLLHRAKRFFADESFTQASDTDAGCREDAAHTKIAQEFQVDSTGKLEIIDVWIKRTGTISGRVWLEVMSDSGGLPSGTILATSDKLNAATVATTEQRVRLVFRAPATLTATTVYHLVMAGDYTIGTNFIRWSGKVAGGYPNGDSEKFDGTTWTADAGPDDFLFIIYITENDAAVSMPSGYDQKALVGYVHNKSNSNFRKFVAVDSYISYLEDPPSYGSISTPVGQFVDLVVSIPTVKRCAVVAGMTNSIANNYLQLSPVPDGYQTAGVPGRFLAVSSTADAQVMLGPVPTEYQGMYGQVGGGVGSFYVLGFIW